MCIDKGGFLLVAWLRRMGDKSSWGKPYSLFEFVGKKSYMLYSFFGRRVPTVATAKDSVTPRIADGMRARRAGESPAAEGLPRA